MSRRAPRGRPGRRAPRQQRSIATVEAILGAATGIVAAEGRRGLDTNRIARRAGVSIGTLYQYFSDKEAIVLAIARRILAEDRAAILQAISAAMAGSAADLARAAIHEAVRRYRLHQRVRRPVMAAMIGLGLAEEVGANVQEVAQLLADRLTPGAGSDGTWAMRLFIAAHATEAVVRAGAYAEARFFDTAAFEEAVLRMVLGVLPELTVDDGPARSALAAPPPAARVTLRAGSAAARADPPQGGPAGDRARGR